MATKIDYTQSYDAPPRAVVAMLTSDEYATLRAERTGALAVTVDSSSGSTDAPTMLVERTLPADVPSFAKSLVGESLKVSERYEWTVADDGTARAEFTARFSAPIAFDGAISVAADGAGTTVRTTGELKASVPFVGGTIEGFAKDSMERYLRSEQRIGAEWLAAE